MRFICLLLCLGQCLAMQPGLEYQYRYKGRLATGVTDVRHQYAAVGIQADVTVQVEEDYSFLIQFQNFETGDFHDDLNCDFVSPIPMTYTQIQDGAELLHTPFKIAINAAENIYALEVPADEPVWITNIRKSVIDIFPFQALWTEIQASGGQRFLRANFGAEQELMAGRCMNWYTATKLPDNQAAREEIHIQSHIEEDVQHEGQSSASYTSSKGSAKGSAKGRSSKGRGRKGSKSSKGAPPSQYTVEVPAIDDALWKVVRVIDFDMCKDDMVIVKINEGKNSDQLISRTSVANYLIRGDQRGIRLERAIVEGAVSVFTSSKQEDRIDTFSNQTVELRAVRHIGRKLTIEYEIQRTVHWSFGLDRPTRQDDCILSSPLEQVLTGKYPADGFSTELQTAVRDALLVLQRSRPDNLARFMKDIEDNIAYLSYEQIAEIFDEFVSSTPVLDDDGSLTTMKIYDKTKDFQVALAGSGSEAALTFLLDKMQAGQDERIDTKLLPSLISNMQISIKNPAIVPKILELAMALPWDDEGEATKSIVLTASASLAHKFCFSPTRRSTHTDGSCDAGCVCDTSTVIDTFLSYLQDGLEDGSSPLTHKIVYLQALSNLGTPQTLNAIIPIILGTTDAHVGLRTVAIMSLSSRLMPHSTLGQVYNLLMPIIENRGEHAHVRMKAFLIMASWKPGISWWKHMAISTWHEPSSQVANLISSTMHAIAHSDRELSQSVSRVLHLAKPAAPVSLIHSSVIYSKVESDSEDLADEFGLIWFASTEGLIPNYMSLKMVLHGLHGYPTTDRIILKHRHLTQLLVSMFQLGEPKQNQDSTAHQIVQDILREKMEQLGIGSSDSRNDFKLFLTENDMIHFAYVFNILTHEGLPHYPMDDLRKYFPLFNGHVLHYKAIDSTTAIPTDLGLPLIIKHSDQYSAQLKMTRATAPFDFEGLNWKGSSNIDFQGSTSTSIDIKTLVPWSQKTGVGSGLRNEVNVRLPFTVHNAIISETKQMVVKLQPLETHRVLLCHNLNQPYTIQYGSFPTSMTLPENDYKVINRYDDMKTMQVQLMAGVGFLLQYSLTGQQSGSLLHVMPDLGSTWESKLLYDPDTSSPESLLAVFTYASIEAKSYQEEMEADFSQYGQETGGNIDYSYYSQFSQSASQDYSQTSQQLGGTTEDLLGLQEAHSSTSLLHEKLSITTGGSYNAVSMSLKLEGSHPASIHAGIILGENALPEGSKTQTDLGIELIVHHGELPVPMMVCFKTDIQKPHFLPFVTPDEILTTVLTQDIKGQLIFGVDCKITPPLAEFEAKFEVTENQKNHIRETYLKKECHSSQDSTFMDILTSEPYDHFNAKMTWSSTTPEKLLNFSYGIYDEIRGSLYPLVSFDYTARNPDNTIDIDATKNLITNLWTARAVKPHEVTITNDLELQLGVTPGGITSNLLHFVSSGGDSSSCIFGDGKVTTFDGAEFPFTADGCWKIMATDCHDHRAMFQARYTDQFEVQVLWGDEGLQFDLTNSQATVNGEAASDSDKRYKIIRLEGAIIVIFSTRAVVKVSDKVELYSPPKLRGLPCGLCGNFDGEKTSDMLGPGGCVYTDPELYTSSWTVPGDGCNAFGLRSKKSKVAEYQETCPKASSIPTGVSHADLHNQCISWGYQEKTEGVHKCTAVIPTPKCNPGCSPTYSSEEEIVYDCVRGDGHQPEDTSCHSRTFATSFPADCRKNLD